MGLDPKARWRERGQVTWAPLYLENTVARPAAEVVVVAQVGQLVSRGFAGELDSDGSAFLDHRPQGAVDRGGPQCGHRRPCLLEQLTRRNGAVRPLERRRDGRPLPCRPFHALLITNYQ